MKLWHSFVKELILSSRTFYFYIEILMAVVFLVLLLFIIPEQFGTKQAEYIYWDTPNIAKPLMRAEYLNADLDGQPEAVELQLEDEMVSATLYETDDRKLYVIETNADHAIALADRERAFAAVVHMEAFNSPPTYTYYLQGYETERLRNAYLVFHNEDVGTMQSAFDAQDVRALEPNALRLNDREYTIPSLLVFNGSLLGVFLIAAYIFMDKKEGVIKAYAVTPSAVWQYLMSKVGVIAVTSTITSLIIVMPVMGLRPNYALMVLLLLTTGFFASALGLYVSSFYDNITQAFGVLYILIILLMLPNIAHFIPSWNPIWIEVIPTYPMLEGFEAVLLPATPGYVLLVSGAFALIGGLLFVLSDVRFKKTLTV